MSAVIGILNKHAVALAADSAVTISGRGNRKIFNTANKIFTLSKYHPVGVMVYNSAFFMGTPWEIIIKTYREQLKDTSFNTVEDYLKDFIKFITDQNFFSDRTEEDEALFHFFMFWLDHLMKRIWEENKNLFGELSEENKAEILSKLEQLIDSLNNTWKDAEVCDAYIDYNQSSFSAYTKDIFDKCMEILFKSDNFKLKDSLKSKLRKFLFYQTRSKPFYHNYTGLIFVGYGDQQIYPKLIPLHISFVLDGKPRFYVDNGMKAQITSKLSAAIRPFAQTDVIDTVLSGIDPQLESIYNDNFLTFLKKYNELVAQKAESLSQELASLMRGLDLKKLHDEYSKENYNLRRQNYIDPLMEAVGSLSKEDLSEMAESLIYLTYLKRRFTFEEESVGGPVDVALITKGDGFIWIKRKHYFKPELNHHFFTNYLP